MADLHHLLAIYVHAYRTGNSVPPHIDAEARAVLAAEPPAPAEPVATLHVSDFRGYENYDFQHLIDLPPGRYELFTACTAHPPAPVPADHVPGVGNMVAADGEREKLAQWLYCLAGKRSCNRRRGIHPHPSTLTRAAVLLQQAAPAPVPVAVADRPWKRLGWCDAEGRCWWGRGADDFFSPEWTMATLASIEEFCSDAMPQHCLPHWAIPVPQPPQGGAEPPAPAIGPEWRPCVKLPITVHVRDQRPDETCVSTREGITPVRPDDLIMRGVQGEEYPIGRDLFNRTYRLGTADPGDAAPAPAADPLQDFAAALIASQQPMDPDVAAALTPEGRWEMYDGDPAPAADGEREELAQWLDWLLPAFHREHDSTHASNCLRAAALLRQPAPAPVPGWQPISTAPRDGTEILAGDWIAIEIVNWNCDPSPWDSQTGDGPAWRDRDGLRMFPAWWQPLPDHPPIPTPTKTPHQ